MTTVAEERITRILERAWRGEQTDISTALKMAERKNYSIPSRFSLRICEGCEEFLRPGENSKVRLSGDDICYTCDNCGEVNRHGY